MQQSGGHNRFGAGLRVCRRGNSMLIRTVCLSAVVACVSATAALPSSYGENPPRSTTQMLDRHGKLRLPRELKMVWRQEEHARLKAMPNTERHGWLKRRWAAMSI